MSPLSLFRKKPRPEPRPTLTLRHSRSGLTSLSLAEAEDMGLMDDDTMPLADAMEARVRLEDVHE